MDFSKNYNGLVEQMKDLDNYDLHELKKILANAKLIQQEYKNLELIVKRDSNSLYGTSASIYFSLVDFDIAEDITMTGKHYCCLVDRTINLFFKNWGVTEMFILQGFYPHIVNINKLNEKDDVCVYGDTDSRYLDLGKIYSLIGIQLPPNTPTGNLELADFAIFLMKNFINNLIKESINADIEYRNANPGYLKMAHEVTMRRAVFQKKKKYVFTAIWKDGKMLNEPKLNVKGVELKKGELNNRIKKILTVLVNKYMVDEYDYESLRVECLKLMRYIKNRHEKDFIYKITSVSNLKEITKNENGIYVSDKKHIQMKIAISWMNFIEKNNLKGEYRFPFEGQKMYYYYDINGNVMGITDDYDINKIPGLPEPDWNKMLNQILVKPLLKYIYDDDDDEISDVIINNFLLGIMPQNF